MILKAIEDLNLTQNEATSIRNALQGNSSAQLGSDDKLLAVYNAMIKLEDDHRSYFHIGGTELYKVAFAYINSLSVTPMRNENVDLIKGTGYGAFFLNKRDYEIPVDKVVQKINENIPTLSENLQEVGRGIIEYRAYAKDQPTLSGNVWMSFPIYIFNGTYTFNATINGTIHGVLVLIKRLTDPQEKEQAWNLLVEAVLDRSAVAISDDEIYRNLVQLFDVYVSFNGIKSGENVSGHPVLNKLYTAIKGYGASVKNDQVFNLINEDGNITYSTTEYDQMNKSLKNAFSKFWYEE